MSLDSGVAYFSSKRRYLQSFFNKCVSSPLKSPEKKKEVDLLENTAAEKGHHTKVAKMAWQVVIVVFV